MDERCALRHSPEVLGSLRSWSRTLEAHQRGLVSTSVVAVTADMYAVAVLKAGLALTRAPTFDELVESTGEDWESDRAGRSIISFERFKDAMFQVADTYTETMLPADYSAFLLKLLRCCTAADGSFLDNDQISRGSARPPGFPEDESLVTSRLAEEERARLRAEAERRKAAMREEMERAREEMESANERRKAAMALQRQQRAKLNQVCVLPCELAPLLCRRLRFLRFLSPLLSRHALTPQPLPSFESSTLNPRHTVICLAVGPWRLAA